MWVIDFGTITLRLPKPDIQELPRITDRASFVYLERCSIAVNGGSIIAFRDSGRISIPSCSIAAVILGPGVSITTDAIRLLAQGSTPVVWMSSDNTRFYAYGRSLSSSSKWLVRQAKIVSQEHMRLESAKKMYSWRFSDDVRSLSMRSLRSIEGKRMKELYIRLAHEHGFEWNGRRAEIDRQHHKDNVNHALTIGNQILYAVHLAIILSIGCVPGLGIVHNGRDYSFIYDISDIYKAFTSIPIAFDVGTDSNISYECIDAEMRKRMRKSIVDHDVLHDSLRKIFDILGESDISDYDDIGWVDEGLWSPSGIVEGSVNYGNE